MHFVFRKFAFEGDALALGSEATLNEFQNFVRRPLGQPDDLFVRRGSLFELDFEGNLAGRSRQSVATSVVINVGLCGCSSVCSVLSGQTPGVTNRSAPRCEQGLVVQSTRCGDFVRSHVCKKETNTKCCVSPHASSKKCFVCLIFAICFNALMQRTENVVREKFVEPFSGHS